jgi:hypothetical protein
MAIVETSSVSITNIETNLFGNYNPDTEISTINTANINANIFYAGRTDELANDLNEIGTIGISQTLQPLYRGFLSGEYVYSLGTAPIGATDIVIIGYR